MKNLDNNYIFLSKSSPINFFCTNIDWKNVNVLVNDERDVNLINFLIHNNIFDTKNKIYDNIWNYKKDIFNIILWEPLNESINDFNINISWNNLIINEETLDFYKKLSNKEYANEYVRYIWIIELKDKNISSVDNILDFIEEVNCLTFPYVIKTFNWKWWKGTFIVNNQSELYKVKFILSDKVVWEKSENLDNKIPIILIERYISDKIDINVNIEFYEEKLKKKYNILWITQQLTEWTLYRWNASINQEIKWLERIINSIANKLLDDGYVWNIWIDFMYDKNWNLYFNKFNTRFNSSTLFTQFIKNDNYLNSEIVLFETRNGVIDLDELQQFLLEDWIKWQVLPYEVNWNKWTIILLLKWPSTSRFMNKNISTQNTSDEELKEKKKLLKRIRKKWFFEVRFDMCSRSQVSSQEYYKWPDFNLLNKEFPLIVFTWPRGAWKNYFSEQLLSLHNSLIDFVPQVTYRERRDDDNPKYIKTISDEEFYNLKDEMFVSSWKYWILKDDINKVILSWKIPISILWWKEILKLEKKQETWLLIYNITYPINNNWTLSSDTVDIIKNERFLKRGWSNNEMNENVVFVKKYMNLFFNHPTFRRFFDHTHITTLDGDKDFISDFWNTIQKIINGGNI